jgi:hypothetical protein
MDRKRIGNSRGRNALIAVPALTLLLTLAVSVPTAAQMSDSGAAASRNKVFGLSMGMPLAQLENTLSFKKENDMYVGVPPEPSDVFNKYGAIATRKSGLCDVVAMTADIAVDNVGDQVKNKVDEIAKILEVKYGHPSQKIATLEAGFTRERPQYWALNLSKGAVSYGYVWKSGEKGVTLPGDFESITVMAFGTTYETARANLQYTFKNTQSCEADIRTEKAAKL